MLTDFNIQAITCILNMSNGIAPQKTATEGTELEVAAAINQAIQILDINAKEFEIVAENLGFNKYCSLYALKLAYVIFQPITEENMLIIKEKLNELTKQEILGNAFRKYIYSLCVNRILRFRLLAEYKDFVAKALEIIKDSDIDDISLFC